MKITSGAPSASELLKRAGTALRDRQKADVASREASPTILSPRDILGEYDGARLLMTTIGGAVRPITSQDLVAFRQNAKTVGDRYKGGITPQGIIDHSRPEDRKRCREQIKFAVPARHKDGRIQFVTNAGPGSDVQRHFVTVELEAFGGAVASPNTPGKMADLVTRAKIKFDCDCGRHTYWFRYISTIGRFNAGRPETGFPKVRNPELTGIACKHVLRVMVALREGAVRGYVAKMIEQARAQVARKAVAAKPAVVQAIIEAQRKRPGELRTTAQRRLDAKATARLKAKAKRTIEAITAENRTTANRARLSVASLLQMRVITQKQADAMLARIKG